MAMTIAELINDLDTRGIEFQVPPNTDDRVIVGVATQDYFDDEGNFSVLPFKCV